MQQTWKSKPEVTARCPSCREVFPLGYNFCPDAVAMSSGPRTSSQYLGVPVQTAKDLFERVLLPSFVC
jgi:hypothetical protein